MWFGLFALHRMCASMPVCMCWSMFIYASWQCIHFLLGKEEQMNKQPMKEGWPGGFVRLCVHISVCLCVCVRERKCEVITKVYFMSCFGPPSVCFVYLGGHNSFGWLDCVSKMCSLPPARHINYCLPCWLTLHHTNPSPKTTLATVKKYPTKYFFTRTIRHFATPRIFTKSIYSVVFQ